MVVHWYSVVDWSGHSLREGGDQSRPCHTGCPIAFVLLSFLKYVFVRSSICACRAIHHDPDPVKCGICLLQGTCPISAFCVEFYVSGAIPVSGGGRASVSSALRSAGMSP